MKKYLSIILSLFFAITLLAQENPLAQQEDDLSSPTQASEEDTTSVHVYDFSNLLNPTLRSKFEEKLSSYTKDMRVRICVITLPNRDSLFVENHKAKYLREARDVAILLFPSQEEKNAEIFIYTENEAAQMLSLETCAEITRDIKNLWLIDDNYEAATIQAVDQVIARINDYESMQISLSTKIFMSLGIIVTAFILYKFSTARFRSKKEEKGDGSKLEE